MADAYSCALLAEFEENNIPKLKNKLVKYFQSKKSGGGDCEVDYEQGSRTALLRFRSEEDQKNVLGKGSHQINVDKGVLKMTVRLPTDQGIQQETQSVELNKNQDAATNKEQSTDERNEHTPAAESETVAKGKEDETAEEELQSNSAVLENIPDKLYGEFLEMLVENISKDFDSSSTSQSFTLEAIPAFSSAVVTFQSEEENNHFVTRCPQNRTFKNKGLSVRILEPTDQVVVDDIKNFSEDYFRLYFENTGWDVENVTINEGEQFALISFKDHRAVQDIMKKKHHIKGVEIKVYPFYKSLGTALYGKDKPSLKLPAAIFESIDGAVWKYLNDRKSAAETVRGDLVKHFCNVNLQQSTVCLSPFPTLLQQKDAEDLIKEWTDVVKSAFVKAVSKFKSLKLQLGSEVWEESEDKIRKMLLNEDVVVVPHKTSGVLSVAGLVDDVNRLEKTLPEVVNKIVKRVHREKSSITQEIQVRPSVLHILCQDGLQGKLLQVYPELKISSGKDGQNLIVTGLGPEVLAVQNIIYQQMLALKKQNLEMDNFVISMLKDEDQEELTKVLLTSNKINAAFEIASQRVQLLAVSDRDLNDAVDHLRKLLISKHIDVEDINVLNKPEWQKMILQLENANSELCRKIQIQTKGSQVVVSGNKDTVARVSSKLDDYLQQNAQVEEVVAVKNNTIVEYIKKHHTSWLEQVAGKVEVSFQKEAIYLSGSRVNVTDCKTSVEDSVSSVYFESLKVSKPGVKKFFKDNEAMYAHSLMTETGCLVQLVNETKDGQKDDTFRQVQKPVYQVQTPDGVEIAVCKADMCSYPVHAVVNASNKDLDHNGGLSAALLKAAGPQFQDECDKLIKSKGQLMPGDTVITGAGGQLCCKKVIHAVGPNFDPTNPKKALALLKRAVKGSLDLAEQHSCVSVALPAISRNQGFPLNLCAVTIVKAVKEHCEDKYDDITLKRIHFVNNDDGAVQAMEAAVRQEFGNHGVSSSQQTPTQTVKSPVKQVASDPNCLCQGLTKEGMGIILTTGNIENATTEVIVNTASEDLALNRGAVSSAILGAAGPKLQQLVKAKNAKGNVGEVIVTDGCNLKCKHVFHAIAPHWNNGQGATEKALSDIFKDCLSKAEASGLTSISFSAIGSGNLGFPRDLVASLMLDETIAFSSKKKPKHLKKVMIVLYPKDADTIQAFIDEFKQKFSNISSGPVASSSTQSSGPFSKITSSSGMHETQMGAVVIQVVTGDITKETSDVIVNSSNEGFTLKSGVSKAILDAAGQAVEAECQTLGAQPNPGIIMTQPGNLKCKKILHLVGQTDLIKIQKVVKDALLMCVKNSHTSVSFPAIGTGQGNVKAGQVADAMLDAVIDVLSQNTSSPLKTVRIVIFQAPMLTEFYKSMHHREATEPKSKGGLWENLGSKIKSFFTGESADKPKKEADFVIKALEVDGACFHICGDSQTAVDKAKQRIDNLISKEYETISIDDNNILSLSDPDYQKIVDIQKNMGVSIWTENKNGQISMVIEGISKNVLKANIEIQKMLRMARDEEDMKRREDLAATVADWQYQQNGSQFQSFDSKTNFLLEEALGNKLRQVKVTVMGQDYTVTMPDGPATDNQGHTLQIKRIDKLKDEDVPEEWDAMPANTSSHAVTIQAGTAEHNEVLKLFQATCKQAVIKIERIQNPILWKGLQIKKRDMEQRNGHQNNEKRLFHGTCHSTVSIINELGFNRSYAGKNAACYGNGTYFAVNASYSASGTYSPPNAQGEKCMYLCRVLTGDYTLGQQGMIVPPTKGTVGVQKYDSLVNNTAAPVMFVIFHDSQAYPEYLITFK
ncbi:poly(ADP-ribose) polymerase family member 14-related sequence 1 isoform X2 [Scomber japonicus]|uniref:poly(ADP-ribose) polymerase family member 14-related sequence 1 isoform X2 n=1 Tax=Scomber japonicus TaxID=13676 RepID=UPI00230611D3|nr:poly(ADP-ribose) polymerase family member 14-related sequence 1 isoform X2 [Scomber japonicus]